MTRLAQITDLPVELFIDILEQVDGDPFERQKTLLAFSRALPAAPLPYHIFFEHVRITQRQQTFQLYRRLRKRREHAAHVKSFSYMCWLADADSVVNLLKLLQDVEELTLWFGPDFAPEHLEAIFEKPRSQLKLLFIRFRPYVQKATYYQFLKGAYFDTTLQAIAKWPRASLPTLSVVQDPIDPAIAPTLRFAQPIVFFHLNPITDLAGSPYLSTVTHLRFRIPARAIARYLAAHKRSLPSVELLDVSGTHISESELGNLLSQLTRLKHLVMDGCPIVSQRVDALEAEGADELRQWAALGKAMAMATQARCKDMERKYKVWLEAYRSSMPPPPPKNPKGDSSRSQRAKKGRRGLATATISLRDKPKEDADPPAQAGPSSGGFVPPVDRLRIIPPDLPLKFIAITAPMVAVTSENFADNVIKVQRELERGWAEGMRTLGLIRQRVQATYLNGSQVYRFLDPEHVEYEEGSEEDSPERELFRNLVKVESGDVFRWTPPPCPAICLAGPARSDHHPDGCPHSLGWEIWRDEV